MNGMEENVDSLESGYIDLLVRVDTNEENIVLHREQIQVLENDLDLLEEEVTVLDARRALMKKSLTDLKNLKHLQM